ncbi:MAG: porin, partial [Paracoccaceae bacterium]
MKKALLNTTALLATAGMSLLVTAGIASADVSLSGFAEIGIIGGDPTETKFHSDLDVKFSLTGESDNGLSYGATIDLDELADGIDADGGPASVFISGAFGTLTLGDTDGALDWALKEAIIGGAIDDAHEHAGYNSHSGLDG